MIPVSTVRESNAQAKQLADLVGVFVGGTNGIGESTAKTFFAGTTRPKAYIIGRNVSRGHQIVDELKASNPEGEAFFLKRDISLLRNVDQCAQELLRLEAKVHCLFLTAGYMTLQGRAETDEGMDHKMVVNYYSRMRWIFKLMPALQAASDANELARVITVLAAGSEGDIRLDDLDLRHNFTLHAALAHCAVFTDFMVEELAKRYPGISFSHSYPGTVKTGIANELTGPVRLAVKVLYAVVTPWILNVRESGDRHLFQITSKCYPAARGGVGIAIPEGMEAIRGSDGKVGSGGYLLDWDGKATGDVAVLGRYREMNLGRTVWEHTMAMFAEADRRNQPAPKRPASGQLHDDERSPSNPIGWRPG